MSISFHRASRSLVEVERHGKIGAIYPHAGQWRFFPSSLSVGLSGWELAQIHDYISEMPAAMLAEEVKYGGASR